MQDPKSEEFWKRTNFQEVLTIPRSEGSNYFIPSPDLCAVHRAPGAFQTFQQSSRAKL